MKFEKHDDLFSFNRTMMEDDYNDGQQLVIKDKRKAGNHEFNTAVKVGEQKDASYKLAVEEKIKSTFTELGGIKLETKFKNNGTVSWESQWNTLKQFGGLENVGLWNSGEVANGGALKPMDMGIEFTNAELLMKTTLSTEKDPKLLFNASYRVCSTATVAAVLKGNLLDISNNNTFGIGYASAFKDTGLQWGASFKASMLARSMKNYQYDFYFNHESGDNTVGAHINYDHDKKVWGSKLGMKLKQADHTWKARVHNTGLMRLALQWQLHQAAKATLNTSVNLKDVPAGSISSLPLNLTLEMKY